MTSQILSSSNNAIQQNIQIAPTLNSSDGNFSAVLANAQESQSWLKEVGVKQGVYNPYLPTTGEVMDMGVDWNTACELIYGVVGSQDDFRDWQKIMSSSDPLKAIKEANSQMYGGKNSAGVLSGATGSSDVSIAKREGNFALLDSNGSSPYKAIAIVDGEGNILRQLANTKQDLDFEPHQIEDAKKVAENFGFDASDLDKLLGIQSPQILTSGISATSNDGVFAENLNLPTNQSSNPISNTLQSGTQNAAISTAKGELLTTVDLLSSRLGKGVEKEINSFLQQLLQKL